MLRLGLDIGTTSIGWCLLEVNEQKKILKLIDGGVRIFPDGRDSKTRTPINVKRREKRLMRRQVDRKLERHRELFRKLNDANLFDDSEKIKNLDVWSLRAKAPEEKLQLEEFARVLLHLIKMRGFKSSRKDMTKDDSSKGLKAACKILSDKLEENSQTLGQFMHTNRYYKYRSQIETKDLEKGDVYFPQRSMVMAEFNFIWDKQAEFYPEVLTPELKDEISEIIFYQRPLKSQYDNIGLCTFEYLAGYKRDYVASIYYQQFRVLQDIVNLKYRFESEKFFLDLTPEQNKKLRKILLQNVQKLNKDGYLSKTEFCKLLEIKVPKGDKIVFNLEKSNGTKGVLQGDVTSYLMSNENAFGSRWFDLTMEQRRDIIVEIMNIVDDKGEESCIDNLVGKFGISRENAEYILGLNFPDGIASLSWEVMEKIIPHLEDGLRYHDACKKAGYNHSDFEDGEVFDQLPYYGQILQRSVVGGSGLENDPDEIRYGKIANTTVHLALNQIRKVVNKIIERYGKPNEINLELARDLPMGAVKKGELISKQKKNEDLNNKIREELKSQKGIVATKEEVLKYKLWLELSEVNTGRFCPYCNKEDLTSLEKSWSNMEIDHIIPFSISYDDSFANKTVCCIKCNRLKSNKTPYEAFGEVPLEAIENTKMSNYKKKKFEAGAKEWFLENEDKLLARFKTDTQYIARLTKDYLTKLLETENRRVLVLNGKATHSIREHWQLNELLYTKDGLVAAKKEDPVVKKNREDHRHHFIDAFVIACFSDIMVKFASDQSKKNENLKDSVLRWPIPFEGYREDLKAKLNSIVISHKPDHKNVKLALSKGSTTGCLHEETALGLIKPNSECIANPKKGQVVVAESVAFDYFTDTATIKNIGEIADKRIREDLLKIAEIYKADKKEYKDEVLKYGMEGFSRKHNRNHTSNPMKLRNIRIHHCKGEDGLIKVKNKNGIEYKAYTKGSNYRADVFVETTGKKAGKWQIEVISTFDAHNKNFRPKWTKKDNVVKIMSLQNNDMVAYDHKATREPVIARVQKMSASHGVISTINNKVAIVNSCLNQVPASVLQELNFRKISVDPSGQVVDQGRDWWQKRKIQLGLS